MPLNPPRLFDKELNKTIMTNFNYSLAQVIESLIKLKYISTFSIRGNDIIYDGYIENENLYEAVERGKLFELDLFSLPEISKLYDEKCLSDQLWITKTSKDLTFEELCDNFIVRDDSIQSQVIHLQYKTIENRYFITHLDHEFVYYTIDEFENRQNKVIKGTAGKRIKTFKINDAQIPIEYMCDVMICNEDKSNTEIRQVPLLYFVLNCFFKNKELLCEYFNI